MEGINDSVELAQTARGRLREKIHQLEPALPGHFSAHHRFLVAQQLAHLDFLDESVEQVTREIEARMRPFAEVLARLDDICGVGQQTAEVVVAEMGVDMSRFPTDRHLASWAGMCPGNQDSGGKRQSGRFIFLAP